jgi:asparagine synthase (glutamine-hydrolysing)
VRVLYAGDGGDELFAGNERYLSNRVFDPFDRLPAWARSLVSTGVRTAERAVPHPLFIKAGKYVRRASLPPGERFISYGFWFVVPPADIVTPDFLAQAPGYRPSRMTVWHHDHARAREEVDRELYLDLKITIGDNDLIKVMRASEHAGIAVRFPFLDPRVADVAVRIPARVRMRGRRLRSFFKDSFRDLLPPEILAKQKHGFGLPISLWLRTDPALNQRMRDLVLGERSLRRGYFRKAGLEELVRRHASDPTPFYGTILWNLMVLELWQRRALDGVRD